MSSSISNGKIWIDLDNSPHVPFFSPIQRELQRRNYETLVTVRDCFQVCGLAELHGLKYKKIGKHYGKNKFLKIAGTLYRALQLLGPCLAARPRVAVSHGSRSQLIAAKLLGIRSVMIADYEHSKGYQSLKPYILLIPELLEGRILSTHAEHIEKYPGIKEDVYIPSFMPDDRLLGEMGINGTSVMVTLRPPATEAHYHNPESDKLFAEAVDFIGSSADVQIVILPRNEKKQGDFIKSKWHRWYKEGKIIIPEEVVNGLNLIWHSDLVVSGGGTMNREAAALGVPVYSIFRGKIGEVDRYLEKTGRLTLIEKPEDVGTKINVTRRNKSREVSNKDRRALNRIVDVIEEVAQTR